MNYDDAREAGLKFYDATKPCRRGHEPIRYVSNRMCAECARTERERESPARTARRNAKKKEWADANLERRKDMHREWRERTAYKQALTPEQKARANTNRRRWRAENPERQAENARRARQSEAGRLAMLRGSAKRRARKLAAIPADFDKDAVAARYAMAKTMEKATGKRYEVDHITSLIAGGLHHHDNLVVMRRDLNRAKGGQDWPWLRWFNDPAV